MKYLYLTIATLAEVFATTMLKMSDSFTRPLWTALAVAGYVVTFYFFSLSLKFIPTGVAYAVWAGVGIILMALIAWLFQGQKLDFPAVAGMTLIIAGVLVMNLFSKAVAH